MSLERKLIQSLIEKNWRIALAESCTGGLLAAKLTDVSGSSGALWGSIVSYSNEAKMAILGVSEQTLGDFGAVSAQTALEMAQGVQKLSESELAVSITGIAGPSGGSEQKPVGTVYVHILAPQGYSEGFVCFKPGLRAHVRDATCLEIINKLINVLKRY